MEWLSNLIHDAWYGNPSQSEREADQQAHIVDNARAGGSDEQGEEEADEMGAYLNNNYPDHDPVTVAGNTVKEAAAGLVPDIPSLDLSGVAKALIVAAVIVGVFIVVEKL